MSSPRGAARFIAGLIIVLAAATAAAFAQAVRPGLPPLSADAGKAGTDGLGRSVEPLALAVPEPPVGRHTPEGAFVLPGRYEVRLTGDEKTLRQPLTVVMDPRVNTPEKDLVALLAFQRDVEAQMARSVDLAEAAGAARKRLEAARDTAKDADARATADRALADLDRVLGGVAYENPVAINAGLASLARDLEGADAAPTAPQRELLDQYRQALDRCAARWKTFQPR
jgi:hypothetical protein